MVTQGIIAPAQAQNAEYPFGADAVTAARYFNAQQQVEDSTAFMLIADSLYTEGINEGNLRKQLMSNDLKAFYFYVHDNPKAINFLHEAADQARQMGMMPAYFSYRCNEANFHLNLRHFNEATELAQQTLEEARSAGNPLHTIDVLGVLANVYDATYKSALAIEQYEQILALAENGQDVVPADRIMLAAQQLAICYYNNKDFDKAETYLKKALAIDPNIVYAPYLRARQALSEGDRKSFKKHYDEARQMGSDQLGQNGYLLAKLEMMNLASEGHVDEAIEFSKQLSRSEFGLKEDAISIYKWARQYDKALQMMDELMTLKDSLGTADNQMQLAAMTAEMRTIYETAEKEAQIQAQKYTLYIGGIILLAVLLIASLLIYRNIEIKKKNLALVADLNELIALKRKEKAQAMRAFEESKVSNSPATEAGLSNVQRYIYELTSKNLFCDPNFDRQELLNQMHFQKSGFWKAFEEETEMTAPRYILNLRLEYAAEQILQHPEYTIEGIAADAGIPSRTTFYRNFNARFGISPMLFREQCQNPTKQE